MHLPAPPKLKTTIIQLNKDIDPEDNNYEVLSNDYAINPNRDTSLSFSHSSNDDQPRKKRRRSSSTVGEEELARRRTETKQLHSMIEKRRRVKINREFEALKYLIPACRTAEYGTKKPVAASNNVNKIDGMYKLTILKTSVEYILYLHHIVQKQHQMLSAMGNGYSYDVSFSQAPLDVNQYRNIDQEFDFHELAAMCPSSSPLNMSSSLNNSSSSIVEMEEEQERYSLPTPHETPEISPILSMLSKYKGDKSTAQSGASTSPPTFQINGDQGRMDLPKVQAQDTGFIGKSFSFASSANPSKLSAASTSTSPFTVPIKSQVSRNAFSLSDPALMTTGTSCEYVSTAGAHGSNATTSPGSLYPRKMFFKSQVPPQNQIAIVGEDNVDLDTNSTEVDKLESASKTLLALRKPSIDRLLN